jgi:hypothetical protein
MQFNFATDEEKAQLARHKLEVWKQAFRLDKKLLYKFDRGDEAVAATQPESKKPVVTKGKSKAKPESSKSASKASGNVHLLLRLGFSGHEKLTEHRWVERIPTEEPFVSASPVTIKTDDKNFADVEKRFESLE